MDEKIYIRLVELSEQVDSHLLDAQRFDEGNSTAGTRVTKMLSQVQKEAKVLRMEIFKIRKTRKN